MVPPNRDAHKTNKPARRDKPSPKGGLSEADERRVLGAISSLQALHPEGSPAPSTPNPPRGQFDFSAGEVEAALKSFPVGSSAGPSGLRPCHLLEMARGDDGSRLLEALASFCSALANNSLSCDCMKLLTTARLVAVAKPNGGVRPIAVGETLRRLAAKCVHEATLSAVSSYLLPTQVGVKVPNAAELVAHKVKAWRQENRQDEIIVQVDLRNAFNSIDRNVLLREVRERVPALYPYAHACYSTPAFLFGNGFEVQSSCGVQQGDVCGPALFAIAIQKTILELTELNLSFQYWYLDDGILCGPASDVARAMAHLEAEFSPAGLLINRQKCRVFCHESVVLPDDLQQLPRVSLSSGSTFLGVPVGGDIFVQQFSDDTLSKLEDLLQKVSRLGSGLGKFLLLRACFGACRVNHLLRTLDFLHGSRLANDAAVPFRKALDDLLRTATSDEQFTLACMASRRGGLGLKNPTWVHGPAFLASCFTYAASADSISHTFWADVSSAWNAVRSAFNLPINFLADFQPLLGFEPRDVSKHWKQQRWWQAHIDSAIEKRWSMQAPLRLRKLKELMAARFSVDVTSLVAPGSDQAAISDRGWVLSACMRIGIALDASDARPCAGCAMPMDPVGDHALCCAKLGVYARHNDLRDTFAALCVDAGLAVEIEQGPDGLRPADVLVHGLDNSPLAVDFSVVHPLQPSADLAEVRPGKLARQTENSKVRARMPACRRQGWSFCPFVVEAMGAWGGRAKNLTQLLTQKYALRQQCSMKEAGEACRTRLQLSLLRSLSRQLERAFPNPSEDVAVEHNDLFWF